MKGMKGIFLALSVIVAVLFVAVESRRGSKPRKGKLLSYADAFSVPKYFLVRFCQFCRKLLNPQNERRKLPILLQSNVNASGAIAITVKPVVSGHPRDSC